jgi:alkylated DNA repair dioxygenase AlkB
MLFDPDPIELLPYDGSAILHYGIWDLEKRDELFDCLLDDLVWRQHKLLVYGKRTAQPRLTAWYGDAGCDYSFSGIELSTLPWTPLLLQVRDTCQGLAGTEFNSVLANLYRSGSDGVSWHSDNEPELGQEPIIASVSLGQVRTFQMAHRFTDERVSIDLPPGSVLVMSGLSQSHWKHQVPKTRRAVGSRINLTFRRIYA